MEALKKTLHTAERDTQAANARCAKTFSTLRCANKLAEHRLGIVIDMRLQASGRTRTPEMHHALCAAQREWQYATDSVNAAKTDFDGAEMELLAAEEREMAARKEIKTYAANRKKGKGKSKRNAGQANADESEPISRAARTQANRPSTPLSTQGYRLGGNVPSKKTEEQKGKSKSKSKSTSHSIQTNDPQPRDPRDGTKPTKSKGKGREKPSRSAQEGHRLGGESTSSKLLDPDVSAIKSRPTIPQATIDAFHAALPLLFNPATIPSLTAATFPDPLYVTCGRTACASNKDSRALEACEHNIAALHAGFGLKELKKARAMWHPDRFARVPEAGGVRREVERKAGEVFGVLSGMVEKLAKANASGG